MFNPCSSTFFRHISKASFSFTLFSLCLFMSASSATLITLFKGATISDSGISLIPITHSPNSIPLAVSTTTKSPFFTSSPLGSN